MCSRHPEEGAGSAFNDWTAQDNAGAAWKAEDTLAWSMTRHLWPERSKRPVWIDRAVNGGWDHPASEEVSNEHE